MEPRASIRPMKPEDAGGIYDTASAALFVSPEEQEELRRRTPEEVEKRKARYGNILRLDPEGAWVAEDDGRISGVALALVREGVWILSLFAVDELRRRVQGAMIASSQHPAAMRSYARAGFDLHPTLSASGPIRRGSISAGLAVRDGEEGDLASRDPAPRPTSRAGKRGRPSRRA